jgi:pectinesterase
MRTKIMQAFLIFLFVWVAHAQDVHVYVSPTNNAGDASIDHFATIQRAMDHAPQPGPQGRLYVHIAPGIYSERVIVTANRPRTTFLGDRNDPSQVVITAAQNAKSAGGTFFSETVDIEAPAFQADGVTFANTAGATGQAVAIAVRSDKAIFKHCRFLGYQDTLFADAGRQYYTDSYITGGVDFIFGNAAAVFDRVEIHEQTPGYLTAQSRTGPNETTGYVIANSTVTSEELDGKTFYLGRPWRDYARVVVLKTDLPAQLSLKGWSAWRKNKTPAQAFFAEYKNAGPGAASAMREPWVHQLSEQEAKQFDPQEFLHGTDGWNPLVEAAKLP